MAYLAIKGELTYEKGKELISILELLGGNNKYNNDGTKSSYWYYIDSEGIIHALIQSFVANDFIFLTLEEYLYRYPYIVGDKVIYHGCEAVVTSMEWNGDEVCYTVLHKGVKWQTTVFYLQPYKEIMEENPDKALASDLIRQDNMEECLNFNSQICTTIEQSQRLLDLGLKPETADMYYFWLGGNDYCLKVDIDNNPLKYNMDKTYIPAWSLHRLIELYKDVEDTSMWSLEYVNYNRLIQCIGLAIKHDVFNKEYLKQ